MNTVLQCFGARQTSGEASPVVWRASVLPLTEARQHRSTAARLVMAFLLLINAAPMARAISDSAGTSNAAFLKIATDARGVALGPAIVSMADGTEGIRWNPAAMGILETKELSTTHIQYYQDVSIEHLAYATPLEDGSVVGGSLFYLSPGSLEGRDDLGNATGDFDFHDLVGTVAYSRRLRTRDDGMELYAGGAFKVVQEKIASTQKTNPAMDLGFLAFPVDDLQVGLSVRNLSVGKAKFPKELTGGASYTVFKLVTGALALRYADDAPLRFSAASEYRFTETLQGAAVRVGYQNHDELNDSLDSGISGLRNASLAGLTAGAGFEYRPPMFKTLHFKLDYAMAPFGALGISHTITVKVKW